MLLFAAFEFAAEAERYISAAAPRWKAKYNVTVLHTLMNNDLLKRDLRKGVDSSMSFFMVGQPDVVLRKADGDMYQVEVRGFDYFSVAKGNVISGGTENIAMWMLDFNACAATLGGAKHHTDYDGLVINPSQVFFPNEWAKALEFCEVAKGIAQNSHGRGAGGQSNGDRAWKGVARALRAEVDAGRMEAFGGSGGVPPVKIEGMRVVAV